MDSKKHDTVGRLFSEFSRSNGSGRLNDDIERAVFIYALWNVLDIEVGYMALEVCKHSQWTNSTFLGACVMAGIPDDVIVSGCYHTGDWGARDLVSGLSNPTVGWSDVRIAKAFFMALRSDESTADALRRSEWSLTRILIAGQQVSVGFADHFLKPHANNLLLGAQLATRNAEGGITLNDLGFAKARMPG